MTKTNLKKTMEREYVRGRKEYFRLWDALTLLYSLGLLSESEREAMLQFNHELSSKRG